VAERNVTVPPEPTRLEVFRRLVDAGDRVMNVADHGPTLTVVAGRLHGAMREFEAAMDEARLEVREWIAEDADREDSPEDTIEFARRRVG
jgi:hypothetical protein